MAKVTGFLDYERKDVRYRPVAERRVDTDEIVVLRPREELAEQAARCMDCGVPFCHEACPLHNRIPDWNDATYRERPERALDLLYATNNFPEFTGLLCPAPCEGSCVLGINRPAVTIKQVEFAIIEKAADKAFAPQPPASPSGKSVGVIGSGPAGLAAAQQLARAGHQVVVYERDEAPGGLLRFGIPDFKMKKSRIDRRVKQMQGEGVRFECSVAVGQDLAFDTLQVEHDALLLAVGAGQPRPLTVPGADLEGVHFAMPFLTANNRHVAGAPLPEALNAKGQRVVILGGGDTGADCLGTCHRQGAASVDQFELMGRPPDHRAVDNPWPQWPLIFRSSAAHKEGGERGYGMMTTELRGEGGRVVEVRGRKVRWVEGSSGMVWEEEDAFVQPADMVLLAMGFVSASGREWLEPAGLSFDARGRVLTHEGARQTTVDGVFAAGDVVRGASLIVWAIAEGRQAAAEIDAYLRTA